ncbi:MAG: alpha-glucuronidase, partial [Deltaproteobacteria bacterium]|nr:alpha-glucuronidase [Deltaproteobacteria bacterium]
EGQPGPQDYGRTHADGANLLGDALALAGSGGVDGGGGGRVIWRAFVYREEAGQDRATQAYRELTPLDGKFRDNVSVQVKNGPIDFQPREPFHPLFGAMPKTPLLVEFQITQEYLGCATHLAYLGPLFKETLDANTHAPAADTTPKPDHAPIDPGVPSIARLMGQHSGSGMAGVANIGTDRNWCGHPFAAANWFAFGRLAWDATLDPQEIADDWLRMTFTNSPAFVGPVTTLMMMSRQAVVDYMTPLGLHHLMAKDHHYGPGPWEDEGRADWTPVYFHRADAHGIGFDRTSTGSNAIAQYHPPWPEIFGNVEQCPERLLLWFHHVSWRHEMPSGRTLWDELCVRYQHGVDSVRLMQEVWESVTTEIDDAEFVHVKELLAIQEREACWWRDACLLYFQTFSKRPFPPGCEPARLSLDAYRRIKHNTVPGVAAWDPLDADSLPPE